MKFGDYHAEVVERIQKVSRTFSFGNIKVFHNLSI